MALTPIPTFPPIGSGTFNADAYAWATHMAGTFTTEANALEANVNAKEATATAQAVSAAAQAVIAATHETNAATQATLAAGSALTSGAVIWITGLTYAAGDVRYSPIDYQVYRRKTSGAGSLDPSADSINWALANNIIADQTGNSGKFLKTDGITTSWANEQVIPTVAVFTASGTWTCPAGVTRAKITVVGGGGSASNLTSQEGIGGGGGGAAIKWATVTPGTVYTAIIGAGGSAASLSNEAGNTGGTSWFSGAGISTISATGGAGGNAAGNDAVGGVGSGGDISVPGGTGKGAAINGSAPRSSGGSTIFAGSTPGGTAGIGYGSGGGGTFNNSGGFAGAPGVIVIEY